MVVRHVETRRAGKRDGVGADEVRGRDGADVGRLEGAGGGEGELLDGGAGAGVVNYEEVGGVSIEGGVDFDAEGVEVVLCGVAL